MKAYSIEDLLHGYEQKKDWEKQFPVSRYIFRPLSFPLTAVISHLTHSPSAVAWFGLGVGLTASLLLANARHFGLWPGITGLALFALLDAVDGNLARAGGKVTLYGKMLDGMLGKIAEGLYFPALAWGLYSGFPSGTYGVPAAIAPGAAQVSTLVMGFTTLCAMLYAGLVETAYSYYTEQKAGAAARPDINARIGSSRFRNNIFYAVFINLGSFNVQVLLLALACAAGRPDIFLPAFTLYSLVRFAVYFAYYMRRAAAELS